LEQQGDGLAWGLGGAGGGQLLQHLLVLRHERLQRQLLALDVLRQGGATGQ
jgi:hypothetical protein